MPSTRFPFGLLLVFVCVLSLGCGGGSSAPLSSDLEQYVRENPDAPKSNGEEPAGINGPAALPGTAGE